MKQFTCLGATFTLALWFATSSLRLTSAQEQPPLTNFAHDKLVAWCIVPFDGKKRGSAERAAMLKDLGIKRVAYDWREEHVSTFEQEIVEYQRNGLEYFAFWGSHEDAFKLFEKHGLHPQIWQMLPAPKADTQTARVREAAVQILPIVERTRKLGSKLGLYNHGGWNGEPANMVAVCEYLREHHDADHVGIVYNQHHAHEHIDDFADVLQLMKPYLLCLNLNGMARDGEQKGQKILPLGEGEFDVQLLKVIRDSGYAGPLGIIGHTQDDVEQRLQDNLDGLDWILPQLDGKPAGPKPKPRTWSPVSATPANTRRLRGTSLAGKPEFRQPPITVECRATLPRKDNYNILVANDTKRSGTHWELFSMNGSGMLTAYLPGHSPDHVRSDAMICDGQPHRVAMTYEPNRVRLYSDGKLVADEPVKRTEQPSVPGDIAIGRLVEGGIGCSGAIDWVRISEGVRPIAPTSAVGIEEDDATLLLWRADNTVKQRQSPVTVATEFSQEVVDKFVTQALASGNSHRGLVVFASAKSACLSCHKIGTHGGSVGPDLSKLTPKRKPHELVESVLWPKRHIQPEYAAHLVISDDGNTHRGYVVHRNEKQLVLRDPTRPQSPEVIFDIASIEFEQPIGTLMPDNLLATMSTEQAHDLFRFLFDLGTKDGVPAAEMNALLEHASAHSHGPATFPYDRKPLHPEDWPSWQAHVNRDRIYDFYAKEADYFRTQSPTPPLLPEFPGLDGGELGHWGNQNEEVWASDRWNEVQLGDIQCGVFRGGGVTVPRGVCVRIGENGELSACFNPDTLTYDAVWKDGFLKFSSVRHGFMHGVMMEGKALPKPVEERVAGERQYKGYYRVGNGVIFTYRIGDQIYADRPQVKDGEFSHDVSFPLGDPFLAGERVVKHEPPKSIEMPIHHGSGSPYAVDTIELPTDNPWNTPLFCSGHDFLPDGSAIVCTTHGDVWHVSDFEYPSKRAVWRRFASGLNLPQGVVVDDDGIFILGRDQITRLHDLDRDGEADFYECFSNAFETSPAGHDFICGLERDAVGNFYTASGNQGVVRISADGKHADVIATGFRNPDGLGVTPNGLLTVPCSEGSWTPASMICATKLRTTDAAPYFGYPGPKNDEIPSLPLAYLPRGLDNSSGGQTTVTSDRWGPLQGQLLHFSFGTGSHFLVLRDEVDGQLQGTVVPLPGEFRSGAHRGRFNPHDGQLYVSGMQGWGSYTPDDGSFQRVRYTGANVQLPVAVRIHENGAAITFSSPLDRDVASAASNHFAQCWNYRYSAAYGSPEFSTKHFGMRGHDALVITGAHLSRDAKTLFLEIPEMQPVNQLHLRVASNAGQRHDLFATVHKLARPFTDYEGYKPTNKQIAEHPIVADLAMALRSIPNPHQNKIRDARVIKIETGSNLSYTTRSFRVRAGEAIELTLLNPDVVPHNWALIKPGTLQRVGSLANRLISDPEAVVRQYIPDSSDVLAYTDVVLPRDEFTIYFRAPEQPGRYPYLCTFPGHWLVMNGEMIVE
ncbi:MAG: heme-binding domain-containing protein [Planctomycetaceae bacterium]|nr:heme-binding domain-containing protein [Planctomycetaceae bacterium]